MPAILSVIATMFVLAAIAGGLAGCPSYNVYSQRMEGEAQLAKAESTRRTRVLEAQAEKDSAGLKADAEVIRAQGVANANKIIADSLGGAEGYLRWRYIEMLQETSGHGERSVIYLPTEAGMPILEAGKRPSSTAK
ncbi:membrane protease subunit [Methylobacterium gnaphalii]|uniref:Membrane protease subunit n=1 Tax=Methylobacterium gnaphalii TaxID=1010610 RepID=A0A512JQP5_9HYPH|nr:membrane protease subunit [Methylobacterium gnaphalii]GEP12287.1 hypothetical protein MGN01_41320 [Methylobacterium gnaphalii]GJD68709.1 hypothetical protein MMMDOFMJ_1633 [Methylobacterium gnaphalii]GLS49394.1 hypothetical protein GCM10007885_22420 [Methylobacterium gnaphalii]